MNLSSPHKTKTAFFPPCTLPARELLLRHAEGLAVLPGVDPPPLPGVLVHGEPGHPLEGPGAVALGHGGGGGEANLLRVQGEHGELGSGEAAWKEKNMKKDTA